MKRAALVSLPFALAAACVHAQAGALTGTIRSTTGRPLAGAEVRLVGTERWARTDSLGQYRLDSVPPEQPFELQATMIGYLRVWTRPPRLLPAQLMRIDLALPPVPIALCPPCDSYERVDQAPEP